MAAYASHTNHGITPPPGRGLRVSHAGRRDDRAGGRGAAADAHVQRVRAGARGQLPARRLGRTWRFLRPRLEAMLAG